ncbi:MAG: DMT family transporter [Phycisphaerae bacterium]|nr:DMT family transporter [Phycisphaerae bacterium]
MTRRGIDIPGTAALLTALLCWSSVPLMLRYLADYVPDGWTTNLVRYPAGAILYLPWFIAAACDRSKRRLFVLALIPAAFNIVSQSCWAWAPYFIEPGLLTFLVRLSVIWGLLAALVLFPEERRLLGSTRFWVGLVLSLGGFAAVVLRAETIHSRATLVGVIVALACGVALGLYMIGVRATMRHVNPVTAFSIIGTYTAVACIFLAPLGEPASLLSLGPKPLLILLFSAIVGIAIAHTMFYFAIQRLGVTICSSSNVFTPFVTVTASSLLFHERFAPLQWVGGVMLVLGTILVVWSQEHLRGVRPTGFDSDVARGPDEEPAECAVDTP